MLRNGIEVDLTPTDVRSFLCLDYYYSMYVEGFFSIDSPLMSFTTKNLCLNGRKICEKSFKELDDILTSTLVLMLVEGINNFFLYYKTSRVGLGCVLMKHCKLIPYSSSNLNVHEKNYPTNDLLLVEVVFSLIIVDTI